MRTAYVEMIGGASGNMLLGALIDAGADADAILAALQSIPVDGWRFVRERVVKRGIAATFVDFVIPGEDGHPGVIAHGRHLSEVLEIIARSGLSERVRERATAIYRRLGEAEAAIHGTTVEHIHFHEVGATDAILDIAGVCIALDMLGIERLTCSAFPIGKGEISMHHGRYPNPPPAAAEMMRGAPTIDCDVAGEMVTPTAVAILTALIDDPGVRPSMRYERIGYGAGKSDFTVPNVTRVLIGDISATIAADGEFEHDEVVVLETNVDDMTPQAFELAMERVFGAGALDVWTQPIAMKKQRPAVMLCAIAVPGLAEGCAAVMLRETTSLGVRMRRESRLMLPREIWRVATPLGEVRVKRTHIGTELRATLEYDDVVRIARERNLPFATVTHTLAPFVESMNDRDEHPVL
ncbi:MAG: nickel pincer cofactor biosynthesis protein LarC [Candidatus Velthaea sp.]